MKPPYISPLLLDKYLKNLCNDQEREQVEAWYASLRAETNYLGTLPDEHQQQLEKETFANVQRELDMGQQPVVRRFPLGWITWLAASVLLVLGIYFAYHDGANQDRSIAKEMERKGAEGTVHFLNREPRVVMHRLPDSSTVWMHPQASIAYPKTFDHDKRIVTFSGEGFFDITRDESRPFSIQSGEVTVRVLGTSFNVEAPAEKTGFKIAVVTGSVEVSAPDKTDQQHLLVLKPKQEAFFEAASNRLVLATAPVLSKKKMYEPVTILFKETPLHQVVEQLEKRFDIDIRLSNPEIASCRLSGDFEEEPLPVIMEMLCMTLETSYSISGKTITIDGQPCK